MRFKIDWASLIVGSKFTVFALFYFVFEGNFPSASPRGAYIWRGDLTEGFLCDPFGGLIFNLEGLIHGGAYFRNFTEPVVGADNQWSDRKKTGGGSLSRQFRKKIKRGFYCNKMNTLRCSNLRLSFTTIEAKKKDCNLGMKKIGFFFEIVCHRKKSNFKTYVDFFGSRLIEP